MSMIIFKTGQHYSIEDIHNLCRTKLFSWQIRLLLEIHT